MMYNNAIHRFIVNIETVLGCFSETGASKILAALPNLTFLSAKGGGWWENSPFLICHFIKLPFTLSCHSWSRFLVRASRNFKGTQRDKF